jgi:hypothetical protein
MLIIQIFPLINLDRQAIHCVPHCYFLPLDFLPLLAVLILYSDIYEEAHYIFLFI